MTKQLLIENEIKKRNWRWIGHTLRKPPETTTRQAVTWNRRGEEAGHGTPGKETQKEKQKRRERDGEEDGHGQKTVAFLGRWPTFPASKQS